MKRIFPIVSLTLIFALSINTIFACGPFTVEPLFSITKHPDYPLKDYIVGKESVVPASYGRISLFAFYRQLNNLPLTSDEQKKVQEAIEQRIGEYRADNEEEQPESSSNGAEKSPDYFQRWKADRAKVLNVDVKIPIDKLAPDEYSYYENCLPDAFNNASNALEARISKYGTGSDVKEWLTGQDAVFSNCGSQGTVPTALPEISPQWLKQDRQYQIAAALFYNGKFSEARNAFQEIADDKNSTWSKTGNFVVARTYIRESSLIDDETPDTESNLQSNTNTANPTVNTAKVQSLDERKKEKRLLLDKAGDKLKNILSDASMQEFYPSAQRLLNLVRYRNSPVERQAELAEALAQKSENPNIKNDLIDYIWLLDKINKEAYEKGFSLDEAEAKKQGKEFDYNYQIKLRDVPKNEIQKDLTDWLITYQAADGLPHAFDKWKQTGKNHWLVAALTKAEKNSSQTPELLNAADKISRDSTGFATIRYYQINLLLETGKRAEAKQHLDEVFANNFKDLPVSTQNKFYSERMVVAANLDEFLKYAQRQPALFVWSDDANEAGSSLKDDKDLLPWKNRTMFDEDAVAFLNEKMPLSVLYQAALSRQVPDHLKKFLIVAGWTRSIITGNKESENQFAELIPRYAKEYSPYFSKYAASAAADREANALITILRNPVIQPYVPIGYGRDTSPPDSIDSNRGNWWCAEDEKKSNGEYKSSTHYDRYQFQYPLVYPDFLTAAQTAEANREHQQVLAAGNSATYLSRRVIDFVGRNPSNPQTPELLHLSVRSTRYGCTDAETTKLSKQAFDILHKQFPRSEWTKKTPYWF